MRILNKSELVVYVERKGYLALHINPPRFVKSVIEAEKYRDSITANEAIKEAKLEGLQSKEFHIYEIITQIEGNLIKTIK